MVKIYPVGVTYFDSLFRIGLSGRTSFGMVSREESLVLLA